MEAIILGLLGIAVGIIVGIIGTVIFYNSSQSEAHTSESKEERIEIQRTDFRRFEGGLHSARLIVGGTTLDFDQVRYIDLNAYGLWFQLAEGGVHYPPEQVDGEVTITVPGLSAPVTIPLKEIRDLRRRKLNRN